jgi:hypothetical protein
MPLVGDHQVHSYGTVSVLGVRDKLLQLIQEKESLALVVNARSNYAISVAVYLPRTIAHWILIALVAIKCGRWFICLPYSDNETGSLNTVVIGNRNLTQSPNWPWVFEIVVDCLRDGFQTILKFARTV